MKKIFGFLMAVAVLFTTSCAKEDISSSIANGEQVEVTFTANLPELGTRAYGDGLTAINLQYFVYEKNGNDLTQLNALCGTAGFTNRVAKVNLALIKGMTYVITFWADNNDAPYDFDGQTVRINYTNGNATNVNANDEKLDAFYGTKEFNPSVDTDTNVELRRPFAQLNAIATDFGLVKQSGINVLTRSEVIVQGYNTLNLLDGKVSGSQDITFDIAAIPEGTITDTNAHLAMNYVLVNEKELVEATFKFYGKHANDTAEMKLAENTYTNVPLQRNYKTNIIGKLLTKATEFNVEILPGFEEDEYDVNVWDGKTATQPAYDDNTKTYTVTNGAELAWIAAAANGTTRGDVDTFIGQTIVLANDIELGGHNWTPISMSTNLAGGETFRGTFDGQGHTISGLVSNQKDAAGLFGYIYAATIENVTVKGASINSNHYAGGIVAWILNNSGNVQTATVIENCHVVNSTITSTPELVDGEWDNGDKAGGLVGYACFDNANNERGAGIKKCSVENTTVKAYRDFGGLLGYASCVAISKCEVNNVTLEQDLNHDYKAPNTPTTYGEFIGRNEGGNTIDGAVVVNSVAEFVALAQADIKAGGTELAYTALGANVGSLDGTNFVPAGVTVTLRDAKVTGISRNNSADGTLVFDNCSFSNNSAYSINFIGGNGHVVFNNCKLVGWCSFSGVTVEMNDCNIAGNGKYALVRSYNTFTMNNCTIDCTNTNTSDDYHDGVSIGGGAVMTMTGCTMNNAGYEYGEAADHKTMDYSSYILVNGKRLACNQDSLVAAMKNGNAILMENDITVNGYLRVDEAKNKVVDIDGNDHTLTTGLVYGKGVNGITMSNMTLVGSDPNYYTFYANSGKVEMTNVTVSSNFNQAVCLGGGGEVVLTDCNISGTPNSDKYSAATIWCGDGRNVTINGGNYSSIFMNAQYHQDWIDNGWVSSDDHATTHAASMITLNDGTISKLTLETELGAEGYYTSATLVKNGGRIETLVENPARLDLTGRILYVK